MLFLPLRMARGLKISNPITLTVVRNTSARQLVWPNHGSLKCHVLVYNVYIAGVIGLLKVSNLQHKVPISKHFLPQKGTSL